MFLSYLTGMGFYVNGAIESKKYDHLTIEVIKEQIRKGTLFTFLEEELGNDIDLSLWKNEDKEKMNEEWDSFANAIDESRKLCVENNGLSLIMAYILESLQERVMQNEKK